MKKLLQRIVVMTLVTCMLLSLTSCGKAKGVSADPMLAKQHVYRGQEITFEGLEDYYIQATGVTEDSVNILMVEYTYEMNEELGYEVGTQHYNVYSYDLQGNQKGKYTLAMEDTNNTYFSRLTFDKTGKLYAVMERNYEKIDEETQMSEWVNELNLCCFDENGAQLWVKNLKDYTEIEGYFWIQMFQVTDNGEIVFICGDTKELYLLDEQGALISKKKAGFSNENALGQTFVKGNVLYVQSWDEATYSKMFLQTLDLTTGEMSELTELPMSLANFTLYAGTTTDFTATSNEGVYTYNIGDAEPVKIMDYVNSDLGANWMNNPVFIDEKTFVASYYDSMDYKDLVGIFTYVDPADIPDKTVLTLACWGLDYQVKRDLIDFNKSNEKYRITVTDYSTIREGEDYQAGLTKMNNDIIAGNVPDMLCVGYGVDINNYISKGLFQDIYPLIEKDEEMSKDAFVQNVLRAYEVDGKLYQTLSGFNVNTVVGKQKFFGGMDGWTMPEFLEYVKTVPEETMIFGNNILRDDFFYYLMNYAGMEFVDPATGTCNFNSDGFVAALEYAKTLPKEFDESYWEEYDWTLYETMYRDDRALLAPLYISSIDSLFYNLRVNFGEPLSFIGFPCESKDGSYIERSGPSFAISAKTANTEGVWEFVRTYMLEEYQNDEEKLYSFPILQSAFDKRAQDALIPQEEYDSEGNLIWSELDQWINGETVRVAPFTQEEVDAIKEFVLSVEKVSYTNDEILNIIKEEAASFFEGQKSAQEVAGVIQSRVQIYVDENR